MGIFNSLMTFAKYRMAGGILRRGLGGKAATGLMAAYFGKKAWDHYRRRRRARIA